MIATLRKAAATEPKVPSLDFRPGMSSPEVARLLEAARTDARRKAEAVDAARAAYADAPSLDGKHAEMAAEVARDIAVKAVERLERELEAAREREAEAERQKAYDAAATRAKAVPDRLRRWDELCEQLAALASEIQEDTRIIEAANRNLPRGAERLRSLEEHRAQPSRTEIVTRRVQGWVVSATGEPHRGGVATNEYGRPNVTGVVQGEWEERDERFIPAYAPPRLLDTLVLPSVAGSKFWPIKE